MYSTRLVMAEFCVLEFCAPELPGSGVPPVRFAAPGVPGVLDAPCEPGLPDVPDASDVPGVSDLPCVPAAPGLPGLAGVPPVPEAADRSGEPGAPFAVAPPGVADLPAAADVPDVVREPDGLDDPAESVAGVRGATRPEMSETSRPGAWVSLLARPVAGRSPVVRLVLVPLLVPVCVPVAPESGLASVRAPGPAPVAGLAWELVLLVTPLVLLREVPRSLLLPASLPAVRLPVLPVVLPLASVPVPPLRLVAAGLLPVPLLFVLPLAGLALRLRAVPVFPVLPELRWRLLCVTAGLFVSVSVSGVPKNMPITSRMMIRIRVARATRRRMVRMPRPVWVIPRHRRVKGPPPGLL